MHVGMQPSVIQPHPLRLLAAKHETSKHSLIRVIKAKGEEEEGPKTILVFFMTTISLYNNADLTLKKPIVPVLSFTVVEGERALLYFSLHREQWLSPV